MNAFQALIEIIKSNLGYFLWIIKQIKKNILFFTEFISILGLRKMN